MAAFLAWLGDYIEARTARAEMERVHNHLIHCGAIRAARYRPFTMREARTYIESGETMIVFMLDCYGLQKSV
jgi:hypothetical protein